MTETETVCRHDMTASACETCAHPTPAPAPAAPAAPVTETETNVTATETVERPRVFADAADGTGRTRWCKPCAEQGVKRPHVKRAQHGGKRVAVCADHAGSLTVERATGQAPATATERAHFSQDALRAAWQSVGEHGEYPLAQDYASRRCASLDVHDTSGAVADAMLDVWIKRLTDACEIAYPQPPDATLRLALLPVAASDDRVRLADRDALRRKAFRSVNVSRAATDGYREDADSPYHATVPTDLDRAPVDRIVGGSRHAPGAETVALKRVDAKERVGLWDGHTLALLDETDRHALKRVDTLSGDYTVPKRFGNRARPALKIAAARYVEIRDALKAWQAGADGNPLADRDTIGQTAPVGSRVDGASRITWTRDSGTWTVAPDGTVDRSDCRAPRSTAVVHVAETVNGPGGAQHDRRSVNGPWADHGGWHSDYCSVHWRSGCPAGTVRIH